MGEFEYLYVINPATFLSEYCSFQPYCVAKQAANCLSSAPLLHLLTTLASSTLLIDTVNLNRKEKDRK